MTYQTTVICTTENDATNPYWDRGFLYAESIYDVIPFYGSKPYKLLEHYQRLQRDLQLMKISFSINLDHFQTIIQNAIAAVEYTDGAVYVQVTAGNTGTRCAMPETDTCSTLVFHAFEYPRPIMNALLGGIKLSLFPDTRGAFCHVKSTNRLPARMAMLHAKEQGATEALWHHPKEGTIHEGCTSNIFFIQDHQLITPSLSPYIFPGLARETVLTIADEMKINTSSRDIHIDELRSFQGAFITGCTKQLVPVRQIDKHSFSVHPLWSALFKAYNAKIDDSLQDGQ